MKKERNSDFAKTAAEKLMIKDSKTVVNVEKKRIMQPNKGKNIIVLGEYVQFAVMKSSMEMKNIAQNAKL